MFNKVKGPLDEEKMVSLPKRMNLLEGEDVLSGSL